MCDNLIIGKICKNIKSKKNKICFICEEKFYKKKSIREEESLCPSCLTDFKKTVKESKKNKTCQFCGEFVKAFKPGYLCVKCSQSMGEFIKSTVDEGGLAPSIKELKNQ